MEHLTLTMASTRRALTAPRVRDERGDVPGWVMIVVMTAGIVAAITAVAQPQLAAMLNSALSQVR